ncbi:MAG TPA: PhoH family protein [bacterium]|nr:PhoH family protein [bacterium]HQL63121.1 PhoH family protein [bacterium]
MSIEPTTETSYTFKLLNAQEALSLFGRQDQHLRMIQERFAANIVARGDEIKITGVAGDVARVVDLFDQLLVLLRRGEKIRRQEIQYALDMQSEPGKPAISDYIGKSPLALRAKRGTIKAKTINQHRYMEAIANNDIVFCIGPAGTGKTYLAVAAAVAALERREVRRIILTRPAVEAGESLGFLPGDLQAKVDPYLRPLYDALYDMLDAETVRRYVDQRIVEIAPLAYMRGRTLNSSFVILDEGQNTTSEQMKMFVTRLGMQSKAIITGDITQIDLPLNRRSGLVEVCGILEGIQGISFVYFSHQDVVRHPLVQQIVAAYGRYTAAKENGDRNGGQVRVEAERND